MKREFRVTQGELRAERDGSGKRFLSGYAAKFDTLSREIFGFKERIAHGAFTRALSEKQDVRYLINHDPNLILGRTKAGTLELSQDSTGLKFRCALPDTSYARDLAESVSRGDINECSFAFVPRKQEWTQHAGDLDERELQDVDLFDVSTVTYPAYPNTVTEMSVRSLFPDGVPDDLRAHLSGDAAIFAQESERQRLRARMRLEQAQEADAWHR